jgi:hypothetical protein
LETLQLDYFTHELEHYYFVDIAGMALWSDGKSKMKLTFTSLADIISVPDL